MRVSTLQINNTMQFNMNSTTSSMNKTLVQLSSGQRLLSASDDVLASNQILGLKDDLASLDNYETSIGAAKNALSLAETNVKDTVDILDRVRTLVLSSGGVPQPGDGDTSTNNAYTQEIRLLVDSLADLANSKSSSGEYVFAGTRGDQAPVEQVQKFDVDGNPVVDADGEPVYEYQINSSDKAREVQISDSQSVTTGMLAEELFGSGTDNVLNDLIDFADQLEDPDLSPEDKEKLLAETLDNIDQAMDSMNRGLTAIGANINTLEMVEHSNSEKKEYSEALISNLEDLDFAQATIDFSTLQNQQTASQKAFAMVNQTTLFDYV